MGMLFATPQAPDAGLLDRLLRPEWARAQDQKRLAEIEHTKAQTDFLKAQAKVQQQNYDQIEQIEGYLQKLPVEQQLMWRKNPELASFLAGMTMRGLEGPGQQQPPQPQIPPGLQSAEQSGELFRPTAEMIAENPEQFGITMPKQPLPSQVANQQLFGGMSYGDVMADWAKKKYGIGESVEPVKTEAMLNPQTGKVVIGQVLRNGTVRYTNQEALPDHEWKQMVVNGKTALVPINKQTLEPNYRMMITDIPQETKFVTGAVGNQPGQIALPPGGVAPGTFFPGAVQMDKRTVTGPRGETYEQYYNPYAPGGAAPAGLPAGPGVRPPGAPEGAVQTAPPKPMEVPRATQVEMGRNGIQALGQIKDYLFDPKTGKINRDNLAASDVNLPRSKGRMLKWNFRTAMQGIRMASTGAAFTDKEIESLLNQYVPSYLDSDQQIYAKWELMTNFLNGMINQMDPNEAFTGEIQKGMPRLMAIPGQEKVKGQQNVNPQKQAIGARFNQLINEDPAKVRDILVKEFGEKAYREYIGVK